LTKDQRTVFVGQLTMKANEPSLRNFFSQIGTVNNIIMIRDKITGRHKGIAYVEMGSLEDIPNCCSSTTSFQISKNFQFS